ncbi:peroxiredoxin family protein [Flavobacterium gelatinilyticum]|uniref:peroxiredoxin family protein n=1 Tax=Flavobacterium gelatinilyticum TaxID=3003260 RepID=UPI0024806240|nr:redoxin domain-containing protein [Flavobacterium gelatinilyticum]
MKKTITAICILGSFTITQAQTIRIDLAKYGGKEFMYLFDKGSGKDTIATGTLDANGKTALDLPNSKKGYAGMSHFLLKGGISVDFIVNKENVTVSSTEEQLVRDNIKFTGSAENDFLFSRFKEQSKLDQKAKMIEYSFTIYNKEDAFYPALDKEKENLNKQLAVQRTGTAQSRLYAARFLEISDFLMGIGSSINQPIDEKVKEANLFVKEKLDVGVLYTSGYWNEVLESWMLLQQNVVKDDAVLLADTKQIASGIKDNAVYAAFAEKMALLYTKNGKDNLVSELKDFVSRSGRVEKPIKKLAVVMNGPAVGASAPALQDKSGKKWLKNTLLFFYESGCNNCENEIHQLMGNYQLVKDKGYEIVSVAADMTPDAANGHDHTFPWKEQLCDFKGFAGPNFVNYGILGTPTIFVIDAKGKITGRYSSMLETGIL